MISSEEFAGWMAMERIEPSMPERADVLVGYIVSAILNVNRGKKARTISIDECILRFGKNQERRRQSPKMMKGIMKVFAQLQNKRHMMSLGRPKQKKKR